MSYAASTSVPVERTRAEIEKIVASKGAGQFMSGLDNDKGLAIIGWTMNGRMVRLTIPQPRMDEPRFTCRTYKGKVKPWDKRPAVEAVRLWEQACRTRWRGTLLIIKAKFEAIETGISTFEREFLADTVMANGQTVGAWVQPQLEAMYGSGRMPALLPAHEESS